MKPIRSHAVRAALAAMALLTAAGAPRAQAPDSAIAVMNQAGPEAERMAGRVGTWDATVTIWPAPGAAPVVTRDLVATRRMVGTFLEERLTPKSQDAATHFERIAYLHYNRVEGRWQYVSMDTRFPAGIMPAQGIGDSRPGRIELEFDPIAFPGWGKPVEGWMLRSSYVVTGIGTTHEIARQEWTRADGSGTRWLAVQFDYRR
jgi:hypothetical protein